MKINKQIRVTDDVYEQLGRMTPDGVTYSVTIKKALDALEGGAVPAPAPVADLKPVPKVKATDTSETVLNFPVRDGQRVWALTANALRELKTTFPRVDVWEEAQKAKGWCEANTAKRKCGSGMKAFLFNWMNRSNDQAGPADEKDPFAIPSYEVPMAQWVKARQEQGLKTSRDEWHAQLKKLQGK